MVVMVVMVRVAVGIDAVAAAVAVAAGLPCAASETARRMVTVRGRLHASRGWCALDLDG